MLTATLVMFVIAVGLFTVSYKKRDGSHVKGIKKGLIMFKNLLPLLILAFIAAGLLQVVIPPQLIRSWLGEEAGFKGIIIGALSGAMIPGGPYVAFPMASSIYKAGAGLGTMVAFITGWAMWSVGRLPYEIALVGHRFTILRYGVTLVFPPLAGFIAWILL